MKQCKQNTGNKKRENQWYKNGTNKNENQHSQSCFFEKIGRIYNLPKQTKIKQ